ncbi:hypothetical protein ACH5A7_21185 [Streptomyces sp. NPDC018955]|uniref:hypothetical protein n=1 Tax=Streptomyces sp. NPDC018955 TaxID=3365055 RepID=UPI00379F2235
MAEPTRRGTPGAPDVCALGRQYGGWRPDSPEATICEEAYGGRTGPSAHGRRS